MHPNIFFKTNCDTLIASFHCLPSLFGEQTPCVAESIGVVMQYFVQRLIMDSVFLAANSGGPVHTRQLAHPCPQTLPFVL